MSLRPIEWYILFIFRDGRFVDKSDAELTWQDRDQEAKVTCSTGSLAPITIGYLRVFYMLNSKQYT